LSSSDNEFHSNNEKARPADGYMYWADSEWNRNFFQLS